MKFSLAVALHLALVAIAAPTPLKLKRDDGDSPSADVASKIAYGSLKSAAHMMDLYDDEDVKDEAKAKGNANTNVPDYGNNMPINMTPNTMATFPGADGKPASGGETKGSQHPAPAEAEKEHAAASPSVSAATPSAAPSFTVGKPSAGEGEHVEDKQEQDSTPAASPSPSASAPAAPKKQSMLESLPVVGSLGTVTGLVGNLSGA